MNLFLVDWDDTLFPTSHLSKNNIDLLNIESIKKTQIGYSLIKLDTLLYKLLTNMLQHGKIIIVTNALMKWINLSSKLLVKTTELLNSKIEIISARERYQAQFPHDPYLWKHLTFESIVKNFNNLNQVISIGDADYEYTALSSLYENNNKNIKYFKAIRFSQTTSSFKLMDQILVLNKAIDQVINQNKHLDLKFISRLDRV